MYMPETDDGTEISRVLLWLYFILLNDRERSLVATADGVNLMSLQCRMEEDFTIGIDKTNGK